MKTTMIGSAHANAWLHALGHELPEEIIILPEDGPKRAITPRKPTRAAQSMEQLLEAYPNPAATNQWLVYQVPEGVENTSLMVRDMLGREMVNRRLGGATGISEIDVSAWPNGLYSATLMLDGMNAGSLKLIVQR